MDCSPPDSSVHGISQARKWSRLPHPSPSDLVHPGTEPAPLNGQVNSLPLSHLGSPAGAAVVAQLAASARGIPQITADSSSEDFTGPRQALRCLHVIDDILSEKAWASLSLDPRVICVIDPPPIPW